MEILNVYYVKVVTYATSPYVIPFWKWYLSSLIIGLPLFVFLFTLYRKSKRPAGKPISAGDEEWFVDHIVNEGAKWWLIIHFIFTLYGTYSLHKQSNLLGFNQLYYLPFGLILLFEFFWFLSIQSKLRNNPPYLSEENYK